MMKISVNIEHDPVLLFLARAFRAVARGLSCVKCLFIGQRSPTDDVAAAKTAATTRHYRGLSSAGRDFVCCAIVGSGITSEFFDIDRLTPFGRSVLRHVLSFDPKTRNAFLSRGEGLTMQFLAGMELGLFLNLEPERSREELELQCAVAGVDYGECMRFVRELINVAERERNGRK